MAKLTDTQKLGVVAGVSLLLAGLGGGGVWWAKGLVQEKVEAIDGMKTEIEAAQAKIRKIPRIEDDVIILRENLFEYVKMLPEASELNEFARVTNQFLSQSGVALTQFVPGRGGAKKGSAFERYTYRINLRATLWQFMQLMSFFENYERFVQIQDFQLTAEGRDSRAAEPVHTIAMTVETYVYRGTGSSKDVAIANYASKVERLRESIFEARQTIAKEGYSFDGDRGRRDIFIDPRQLSGSSPNGMQGPSPRDQRKIIERLRQQVSEVDNTVRRLQDPELTIFDRYTLERSLREQLVALEREVQDTHSKGLISHAPLKLTWNREVVQPLANLQASVSAVGGTKQPDDFLPEAEMRNLLARMSQDLLAGDMQGAMERYGMVEDRIRVDENDEIRYPLFTRIESLFLRAKLAQEFKELEVRVSGILVNDVGKSGVILNGTVYEEGEYVDNNLLVKGVDRDRVEFVYKGFTVVKTL